MALDKVVDSAVLDAGLKQIADAIREKGGTSDSLAFPTAMAEAIAAIQAGGGGGIKYSTGTYTPEATSTNSTNVVFKHLLGEKPSLILFYRKDYTTRHTQNEAVSTIVATKASGYNHFTTTNLRGQFNGYNYKESSETLSSVSSSQNIGSIGTERFTVRNWWIAGNTYIWYAFLGVE